MAALSVSSAAAALKIYYSKKKMEDLTYKNHPLYAMLEKVTNFTGNGDLDVPLRIANSQGGGVAFASAKANKQGSVYKKFTIKRRKDYQLASIETEALLASQDANAFLSLATAEFDSAIKTLTRRVSFRLYQDGTGSLGVVSGAPDVSTNGTVVVTLADVEDSYKFELGMNLEGRSSAGVARLWTTSGSDYAGRVTGIDRDLGKVSIAGNVAGAGTDVVDTDLIYQSGDYAAIASDGVLMGLAGWIPGTAPTAGDSFFGVDRSADVTRLAGLRGDYSAMPLEEAVIDFANKMGIQGAEPTHLFVSYPKFAALEKSLGAKVVYEPVMVGSIGFPSIRIIGPKGEIRVVPDQDCPDARGYMLDISSWSLYSLGDPVRIIDEDGNRMLRESDADAFETRVMHLGNLGCRAPGYNGVMKFE